MVEGYTFLNAQLSAAVVLNPPIPIDFVLRVIQSLYSWTFYPNLRIGLESEEGIGSLRQIATETSAFEFVMHSNRAIQVVPTVYIHLVCLQIECIEFVILAEYTCPVKTILYCVMCM